MQLASNGLGFVTDSLAFIASIRFHEHRNWGKYEIE